LKNLLGSFGLQMLDPLKPVSDKPWKILAQDFF